jgi:small-conductance mechanosensitive channel
MIYILLTILGIVIGITSKKIILNWIKSILIFNKNTYKVKFHVYYVIHKSGSKLNDYIKTDSIEIDITGKNEDEAIEFINLLINNEARIEIESIELCNQ